MGRTGTVIYGSRVLAIFVFLTVLEWFVELIIATKYLSQIFQEARLDSITYWRKTILLIILDTTTIPYGFLLICFGFPCSSRFPRRQQSQLARMLVCVSSSLAPISRFLPLPELSTLSLRPPLSPQAVSGAARIFGCEGSGMPLLGRCLSRVLASSGTLLGKQCWRAGPGYLILATLY